MKKIIYTVIFFSCLTSALAQPSAFKKIMAEKESVGQEVFFVQLKEFQTENIEFSPVYYQLGKMELQSFSELDPIVDRVSSRQFIYNAKINLGLAKNYLEDRDIARNPDWYDAPNMSDKDSIIIVTTSQLDEKYEAVVQHAKSYEDLIRHYDKAVTFYLKAREDFININTSANNLRELFLEADDELKSAVKQVGASFDSSMFHLKAYRETYQKLPHYKKRKVAVKLSEIDHFRMNGISPTNFLADDIEMWSYKQWSQEFLALIEEEVDGLQDEIKTAFKFFKATNDRMMNGDECIQADVDDLKFQRIVNLITKYDNESVLIDIFNYLMLKLSYGNLVVYEKNCNVQDGLPTDDFISRKARIYKNLIAAFVEADSLNGSITTSGHNQETFKWFFDELMPGENGSSTFAESQSLENENAFKTELEKLRGIYAKQQFETKPVNWCYFEQDSVLVRAVDLIVTDSSSLFCAVKSMRLTDDLDISIGKTGKKWMLVGGLNIEEDIQKMWDVESYKGGSIEFFKVVSDSSFVIGGINGKSWFKHVNLRGAERSLVVLPTADTIKNVSYNELQGVFTIIQGASGKYTQSTVNFGGTVTSKISFSLPGNYLNSWTQEQQLWLFSLNQSNKSIVGSIYDPASNTTLDSVTYSYSSNLAEPLLFKNDNEFVTVISKNADGTNEWIYALMDYNGKIHYEENF